MSAMTLMIGDAVRRLTANYTEEEYREYLEEKTFDYLHDIPKGQNDYSVPEITGKERNKDIACLLSEIAEETGYESAFLYEQFEESYQDLRELGETAIEARKQAFNSVASISYEQDW